MPMECRGLQGNTRGIYGSGCKVLGAGKCQGNVLEWVHSAMRMQGNAGEFQWNVRECKVPGECRGMQENARGM